MTCPAFFPSYHLSFSVELMHFFSIKSTVWVESSSFPASAWRRKSGEVRGIYRGVILHGGLCGIITPKTPLECDCSAITHLQLNNSKFHAALIFRTPSKGTAQNPRLLTFARGKACVLQKGSADPFLFLRGRIMLCWRGHILWETTRCLCDLLSNTRG